MENKTNLPTFIKNSKGLFYAVEVVLGRENSPYWTEDKNKALDYSNGGRFDGVKIAENEMRLYTKFPEGCVIVQE